MNNRMGSNGVIQNPISMLDRSSNAIGVILDQTLTASMARISPDVRRVLTSILKEALVVVFHEYFYRVNFGLDVYPSIHIVTHNLFCSCPLEQDCPAATAVKVYLHRGVGEIARTPDPGYFPTVPHYCPVCGARSCYDPELSSHHRGVGWGCSRHGATHYWQHQGSLLRVTYKGKPVRS